MNAREDTCGALFGAGCSATPPRGVLAAVRAWIATAMDRSRRVRPALLAPLPDDRILRDIGVTRHGVRECALAARNEVRRA